VSSLKDAVKIGGILETVGARAGDELRLPLAAKALPVDMPVTFTESCEQIQGAQ
jgi:hypothetical protein